MSRSPALSANTARLLSTADADAERLLGLVRMGVALALAAGIAVAVSAPGRPDIPVINRQINLATIVVAAYFLIGLGSYAIVRAGAYRHWIAWATATLDVSLLATNLWLNLHFAGVSSMFLFAPPAALLSTLVLTFGGLRFRPRIQIYLVLLTGAALTALLLSNPTPLPGPTDRLGNLATTYALPPNGIRIVLVVATGMVVAVAVWRARNLLFQIASEAEQRANLTRFLPSGVASEMTDGSLANLRTGRKAVLAIMFVDIRGFTSISEQETPESAARLLTAFREIVIDVTEEHGGVVDKFIGDGALMIFGLDVTPEAAARAALQTGEQLLDRVAALSDAETALNRPYVQIGVGVHLGEVVVGVIGAERRLEFTVIGDVVNIAARIEQMTKTVGRPFVASEDAFRHAGETRENWTRLGEAKVVGRKGSVGLWAYDRPVAST